MTVSNHFQNQIIAHEKYLNRLALKFTRNLTDAEDLVQETMIKLIQNENKFEVGSNFKAWCGIVLRNTFINNYRKVETRAPRMSNYRTKNAERTSLNDGDLQIALEELEKIIDNLSETLKIPFLMFYQGYSYEEICQHLDVPLGTVKSRIFLARQALKKQLSH